MPTNYPRNGMYRYNIAMREPWQLPLDEVNIPAPPQAPNKPSSVSILTLVLPPLITVAGTIISTLLLGSKSLVLVLPMVMMGLGYPIANLITNKVANNKYRKEINKRQEDYIKSLREVCSRIEGMIERQRSVLLEEFPSGEQTIAIGIAAGKNKRLWWRRSGDADFLQLRLGIGDDNLSFEIKAPNISTQEDPLNKLPYEIISHYPKVDNVPFLVDLKKIGSLTISGTSYRNVIRLTRRLLIDIIIHHSPEDVNIYVLADRQNAIDRWEWIKWVPHTHALDTSYEGQNILFTADKINHFLDILKKTYLDRYEKVKNAGSSEIKSPMPAIVIVLDDTGIIRQHEDLRKIADEGYRTGIYLVFVSDESVPATCRARIEIDQAERINYLESISAQGSGNQRIGVAELVRENDILPLARILSGIEVAGGKSNYVLPSIVRVVDILDGDPTSLDDIFARWQMHSEDSEQVILPVGQYVDRTGLATYSIDFRPEGIGGKGAYHAMMIGTTGSGKSIFMQSMVLAAAHKYSPRQLNFMFMDFKAGAAELKKVSDLPHSVGMVTDLSPALADRALQALENELARRKIVFDGAGKIPDIWDFNRRFPDQAMPHLLVVIDEFAEGIAILPNLVERLKELGRQGRAFGMYFFLANQEVNSAVDQLKANVSWYVLLKVNRQEEMSLIGSNLPVPPGRGKGYIKVKGNITTVQSAYAGLPANMQDSEEAQVSEYVLSTFEADGEKKELYRYSLRGNFASDLAVQSELDLLMGLIKNAASKLNISNAKPIYLEPLETLITFTDVVQKVDVFRLFDGKDWHHHNGERNILPLGYLDIPQRCQQIPFSINFNEEGGHLWIVGLPDSGKEIVLLSLATILGLTHTPDEANIYALDFGKGSLSCLAALPQTAAIIRGHERERIDRLFRFLNEEMRLRTETDWRGEGLPDIYFIVDNIADFRQQYPDQADDLGRFIRSGGAVGIHIIITSSRGSDLPRTLSGNITRRIVLQLAEKQDYMDVINTMISPLTARTEGRGYLVSEGKTSECQVMILEQSFHNYINNLGSSSETVTFVNQDEQEKNRCLGEVPRLITEFGKLMRMAWKGALPKPVKAMDDVLSLTNFHQECISVVDEEHPHNLIPLGLLYDSLCPSAINFKGEVPFWTIIGPRQSGKSTMILNLIYQFRTWCAGSYSIDVFCFRKGILTKISGMDDRIRLITSHDEMVEILDALPKSIEERQDVMHVLMIDDLGIPFANSITPVVNALNKFNDRMSMVHSENYIVIIADLYSNLKSSQTFSSSFIKSFQQSQTGIFFSLDDIDMQWFNARINLQYKKSLKWLPGRGFLVMKGKAEYIQTPLVNPNDFSTSQQAGEHLWAK